MRVRVVLVTSALVGTGLGACSTDPSGEDCLPEPLTARPAEVVAGEELTISTTGFACDASYRDGKQYSLELLFVGRADPVDLGEVDVDRDGSFRATVTVPRDASPGESYVAVHGSPYDEPCDDGASCPGYDVMVRVLPAD